MSFYDDPIVDEDAKRSEESVNVASSLFFRFESSWIEVTEPLKFARK
jgi:hypothetical protein